MPDVEEKKTVDIDTSGPGAEINVAEEKDESVVETEAPKQETETTTQEEVKEFYKKVLGPKIGGSGPTSREPDKEGKYKGKYVNFIRKKRCVLSYDKVYEIRKYGLDDKNYRLYPCYKDVTKPSTLQFCLIYYEP